MKTLKICLMLVAAGSLSIQWGDTREIDAIVADFSHEDFTVREAAFRELEQKKPSSPMEEKHKPSPNTIFSKSSKKIIGSSPSFKSCKN